jgi:DNA polymerase-1
MTTLIADLEADGLLDTITTIHQITTINDDTGELTSYNRNTLSQGIQALAEADVIVGHHFIGYDIPAVRIVTGLDLDPRKVIDTLLLSKLGNPDRPGGHSLDAWGERLKHPKIEHTDWTKWSPEMEHRCNEDTLITRELFHRLRPIIDQQPEAVALEHEVAVRVEETVRRGFGLDVEACHKLVDEFLTEREAQLREFAGMFPPILVSPKPSAPEKTLKIVNKRNPNYGILEAGHAFCPVVIQEFNPGSRQQIAQRLITKYSWVPKVYTSTGIPEVSEETLRELPYPEAQKFADYLTTEKKLSQINSEPKSNGYGGGWLHYENDGRVHASLNSLKAVTGRMSCSSPNVQQVATDPAMRACWVPAKGNVLVGADADGLELRCLGHYLAHYDGGEYANLVVHGDVHSRTMENVGFYDRNMVKRLTYGWLYGAGDAKLGTIAIEDATKVSKEVNWGHLGIAPKSSPSKIGRAVRAKLQGGYEGLADLVAAVRARASAQGKLRGLDGRTLWARSPHSALNLLLQSSGAIIVKKAWTLMDRDIPVVMQVHDEWQIECKPDEAEDIGEHVVKCVKQAGVELGFRCELAASYKIGNNWAETH